MEQDALKVVFFLIFWVVPVNGTQRWVRRTFRRREGVFIPPTTIPWGWTPDALYSQWRILLGVHTLLFNFLINYSVLREI